MFTAKFIKNIFLEAESIQAIGRSGKKTRVFAKQGDSVLVGTNCEKSQTERTNALVAKCVRRIQQSLTLRTP
jgi:hypothetical protein